MLSIIAATITFTTKNFMSSQNIGEEIDVIAINFTDKIVYICEVAVHLVTGLRYVKDGKSDNYERLVKKFNKDINYAQKAYPEYERVYTLWSPIVKDTPDQLRNVVLAHDYLKKERGIEIQLIINEAYKIRLDKLRDYAARQTKELKSPVLRLFQIEEFLAQHLQK